VLGSLNPTANCNPFCSGVDLSGSLIKTVASGNGGCKRVAVFSGSGRISITCTNSASSSDSYMVQNVPRSAWGKKYLTAPAAGNQANNIYRVCVSDPATVVSINGAVTTLPLQNNFFYEIAATNAPQLIEGDRPVMVAQYFTSQGACGNGNPGDPEMIKFS
jgi:IgGFc binding protein